MQRATYKAMKQYLEDALHDLSILAGERVGPSDASWQDVVGTCSVNLDCLSNQLKEASQGNHESFIVFPSPSEAVEQLEASARWPCIEP